ncbi:zf-HC2 domain-containing protein [Sorangium sp. So ce385]|uniref:zf-HC2 domain-containing protein n=1 Tax=Sorangium sp. So ce385 TaxID=3133308 RepID=UPI003F5B8AA9
MNACPIEAVEAYADGTLDPAEAQRVAAHIEACRRCAAELRWLRAEQRLFTARAAALPGPPLLDAVLARAAEGTPARAVEDAAPWANADAGVPARRGPPVRHGPGGRRAVSASAPWGMRAMAAAVALALAAVAAQPRPAGPPPVEAVADPPPARTDEAVRASEARAAEPLEDDVIANSPLCDESVCDGCVPALSSMEEAAAERVAPDRAAPGGEAGSAP